MMPAPRGTDVIVRIPPARSAPGQGTTTTRSYDALVYSERDLRLGQSQTHRAPPQWRDLPLRGGAQLRMSWERYQDYLACFYEGEKGPQEMRVRMRRAVSSDLLPFVDELVASPQPCNVWWGSDCTELDDMPWELLFSPEGGLPPPPNFTFVRGLPPETPPPILPLTGPLRLLWSDTPWVPPWMRGLFTQQALPGVQTIAHTGPVREALRRAADEGIELVHLCADGVVSLAYEGLLYLHGDARPELSAHEISHALRGSRVCVLSLTEENYAHPDLMDVGGREVVSVYRAFTSLSSARVPLPSMVSPLGPVAADLAERFWRGFYTGLGQTHRLDGALAGGRQSAPGSTFAFFARHFLGKLFRASQARAVPDRPERMATALRSSQAGTEQLRSLGEKYSALPDYLHRFMEAEGVRQKTIEAQLEEWARPEEDEK
jgi:hypothetical protein